MGGFSVWLIEYRPRNCVIPLELGHERSKSKNTDAEGQLLCLSNHVQFGDERFYE